MLTWTFWYAAASWVARLSMIPIVLRRQRQPAEATAWLLLIFLQPWVGLLLYVLVGENRLPKRRIRKYAAAAGAMTPPRKTRNTVHPDVAPYFEPLVRLVERMTDMPIVGHNRVEWMADTEDLVDRLVGDIDAAQDHVHIVVYIYESDPTGEFVADALERAVKRGVTCRVLVDAVGSMVSVNSIINRLAKNGVEIRAALPVSPIRRRLARMDLRNHRKLFVIDGRVAYAGSQNIVAPTYGQKGRVWHDLSARLSGPIVTYLQRVFTEDWHAETEELLDDEKIYPALEPAGDVAVQALPSGPTHPTQSYHRMMIAAIHSATQRIVITSPYLVPDEALLNALEIAVMRGVQVDIIVPEYSDQPVTTFAGRSYYDTLMRSGVNLYLHHDGLLHAKTFSIDDALALVGSSNFDIRSFYLNFELNLLLYGKRVTRSLREHQEAYLEASRPLDPQAWRKRPLWRKLTEDIARLLSPLL